MTSRAAATGTSSSGGRRSISIRSRCGRTFRMRRWRRACWRRRRGCSRWSSGRRRRRRGTRRFRCLTCLMAGGMVGRFYLDMHPREGKDKWFSAAPMVTGVRGRALPEAALICNFPGGDAKRSGLAAVLRRGDVLPRVRAPDARDSGRADGVGGAFRVCDGGRLHRSAVADAGGVFPRREAAAGVCEALRDGRGAAGGD